MIEIKRRREGKLSTERQRQFVLALFQTCDVEIKLNQSTFNSAIDDVMSRDEKQGENFLVQNPISQQRESNYLTSETSSHTYCLSRC